MTVHIVKLSVGTETVEDLVRWQRARGAATKSETGVAKVYHTTRMVPKRQSDILDGGSMYWVIKGVIQARQRIIGFEDGQKSDGTPACRILLDRKLVAVRATPRRAFQGWRYLEPEDAPEDLDPRHASRIAAIPPQMRRELSELCLI